MYAAACSSASGSPPSSPASSSAARRSASPVRLTRNPAATCGSSTGTSRAWPGGQIWFRLVISTRPGPAGGTNRATEARSGALSNTSSHGPGWRPAPRAPTATGSPRSAAPSWAASSPNPAASTAGSSAGELPAHPDLGQMPVRVLHRHAGLARAAQPAQRHHPRPGAVIPGQPGIQLRQQLLPPGQEHRPRRQPQRPARRHRPACRCIPLSQLVQLALDPGAQPLDQALQIAELRRAHLAGHLIPERRHQRQPLRILQIRQAHIGNAGAQQRHPRNAALPGPPELQMRDRQALRIVLGGLKPVPVPRISTYRSHAPTSSRQLSRTVSLSGR